MTDIFIHQIKAAGKSVEGVLSREYKSSGFKVIGKLPPIDSLMPYNEFSLKFENLEDTELKEIKALSGHIYYDTLEIFFPHARYFTIIRNPLDRAVSFYYYSLRNPDHAITKFLVRENVSLNQFLCFDRDYINNIDASLFVKNELELILINGQSKFIAGFKYISNENYNYQCINNIERDKIIAGTVERLEETLIMFKHFLGWRFPLMIQQNNKRTPDQKLDTINELTLKTFHDNNLSDYILYDRVNQKLDQKISQIQLLLIKKLTYRFGCLLLKVYVKLRRR